MGKRAAKAGRIAEERGDGDGAWLDAEAPEGAWPVPADPASKKKRKGRKKKAGILKGWVALQHDLELLLSRWDFTIPCTMSGQF